MFDQKELAAAIPRSWTKREVNQRSREQSTPDGQTVVVRDIVALATR
jgi:hypothetical protein